MRRWMIVVPLTWTLIAASRGDLLAQSCIGSPMAVREYALAPAIRLERTPLVVYHADGSTTISTSLLQAYMFDVAARPTGRLALNAGYSFTRMDNGIRRHGVAGGGTYELARGKGSLCLTAGADYSRSSDLQQLTWLDASTGQNTVGGGEAIRSDWVFPVGMAVGSSMDVAAGTPLAFYFQPQFLFIRHGLHQQMLEQPFHADFASWNQGVGLELGTRLRHGPVFGGMSYLHTTWGGRENALTFTFGYVGGW